MQSTSYKQAFVDNNFFCNFPMTKLGVKQSIKRGSVILMSMQQ